MGEHCTSQRLQPPHLLLQLGGITLPLNQHGLPPSQQVTQVIGEWLDHVAGSYKVLKKS
jgi:hypothetical protein